MTTDPTQRLHLFNTLARLPGAQFNALLFAVNAPTANVAGSSAPPGDRVRDFLTWAESPVGCGLDAVLPLLEAIVGRSRIATPEPVANQPILDGVESKEWKEHLGNGVYLEMVNLPAGRFWMGSPASEVGRTEAEGPVHSVSVPALAMGKYPVTQAEWGEVAALPPVNIDLKPFPSRFKGDHRPVEQVNWYEAVEFCDRLSRLTQKPYRLPSEAEWEYACRAHTHTPFSLGATISSNQANYNGNHIYGTGIRGISRLCTTDVDGFAPNSFGVYDLHGNVWEWCQDVWHPNYEAAPNDGSPWLEGGNPSCQVLRGGSWKDNPRDCRSASRGYYRTGFHGHTVGFRVVCIAPKSILGLAEGI